MRFSIDRFALTAGTACAVLFLAAAPSAGAQPAPMDPELAWGFLAKPEVRGTAFMVTAANPLAVEAGYDILKAGGNAVDAAIATQMVLNLVEPQSSGIGGGAFLLYYDAATGTLTAYDGRETAPAAATPDLFLDADGKYIGWTNALTGGRSTGVPGVVRMLGEAHAAHGKSAWADLFTAAIALSELWQAGGRRVSTVLLGALQGR